MKNCANPACGLQQPDGYLMCKVCWKSVPIALRRAFNDAGRAFGPRSTWKKQIKEQPGEWASLSVAYDAAVKACFDALKNVPQSGIDEIKRMMP